MSDQTKFIQVLAMVGAVGQGFAHDFGFPMPRVRKGNKYTPPKQDVQDFSTMTRQQRRHMERKAGKRA